MYGYVYLTTNLCNNKKYIGRHKSNKFDFNYNGSGNAIKNAIAQYGKSNFVTVLIEKVDDVDPVCDSEEDLQFAEWYYIEYFNAVESNDYYNLVEGGICSHNYSSEVWNKGLTKETDARVEKYGNTRKETNKNKDLKRNYDKIIDICENQDFVNYYYNHDITDVLNHFHIGRPTLFRCLEYCNISNEEFLKVKLDRYNINNKNRAIANSKSHKKKVRCIETGQIFDS